MKAKIEYLPFVKNDLEEAFIWYKKINPKLANSFIQDYKTQIKHISEFPLSCEQKFNSIRISLLNSFPFGIHYKYKKILLSFMPYFTLLKIRNYLKQ